MPARPYVLSAAAVAATAAVGSAGTDVSSTWYRRLDTPRWQPPGPAFGIAWTALYALLATGSGRAMSAAPTSAAARSYRRALAVDLVLNAGWPWAFFRARRPVLALVEVLVLEASTIDLTRRAARLDRVAGACLLPYVLWTGFATALTASIARRNPGGVPQRRLPRRA